MSIVKRLAASHILLVDRFGRLGLEVPVLRLKTKMCYRTTTDASSRALKYAPEFSKKMVQKLNINLKQTGLVMGATGRTFDRSFDRLLVWADLLKSAYPQTSNAQIPFYLEPQRTCREGLLLPCMNWKDMSTNVH